MDSSFCYRFTRAVRFFKARVLPDCRYYTKELYDRGKARENVHFLKIEYEQLLKLMKQQLKEQSQIQRQIKKLLLELDSVKKKIAESEKKKK